MTAGQRDERQILQRGDSVIKKEMIAMLLAGGQGSRLGVLTSKVAKPAVAFGGKYRIIDFPLSNCINSGVDTVGVLTQYQPLRLNTHIGIGIPWDLDRNVGGVTVLPPYEKSSKTEWYTGTANAIYQNLNYMETYNPEYVLILSGDHIYKMDYEVMLDFHKATNADVTIAVMPVPMEEASRFGIVVTDENNVITDFQEKPAEPKSNLASMGIYIFSWKALRESLIALKDQSNCDFGKHIIPWLKERGEYGCLRVQRLLERRRNTWFLLGSKYGTDRYHSGVQSLRRVLEDLYIQRDHCTAVYFSRCKSG